MTPQPNPLTEFRHLITRRAKESAGQWDRSRELLDGEAFASTLGRLRSTVRGTNLPAAVQEHLLRALEPEARRPQDLVGILLKEVTGLPATKAFRALCIYFGLVEHPAARWPIPRPSEDALEQSLHAANPFDLLLHSDVASVLDLGAGDLTFARGLADRYHPLLRQDGRELVLHCLDRIQPGSSLGGPLHPDQSVLAALRGLLGSAFAYFGNQDMFDLRALDEAGKLAPRYTIVTCWAPATPTFAYEPARLAPHIIAEDLRRTKGVFRRTQVRGEAALEVQHGDRALLFPPWKFDILGPLALLELLAERGCLCVLGSVDNQVFWEMLAQLLDDSRFRPANVPFNTGNLPEIFGDVYRSLDRLPIGDSVSLAAIAPLRKTLQSPTPDAGTKGFSFRQVHVRRGATYPGAPASSTAQKFSSMIEEATPWCLALVPQ